MKMTNKKEERFEEEGEEEEDDENTHTHTSTLTPEDDSGRS